MKIRASAVLMLVFGLALLPSLQFALASAGPARMAGTPTPYSERLDIYIVGSNDYWQARLGPVNSSQPAISAAEAVSGVTSYELTAVQNVVADPSSQLFWKDGYDIIKLPFEPTQGAFLNVTAASQSAAQSVANDFDSLIGANFVQIGSSGGNYTFFSPASFSIAGAAIMADVPVAEGGLADIFTASSLSTLPTPTAILTGVLSGSSFVHVVEFGSTQPDVTAGPQLIFAEAVGLQNSTLRSSPRAPSQVFIHVLDGLIETTDAANVSNDQRAFTGVYSLHVPQGSPILPNVTLLQNPPVVAATRTLSTGSTSSGGYVSVTLTLSNVALVGTADNVTINDDWWKAYPSLFSLSAGNSSFSLPSLAAGQSVSRAYSLRITSTNATDFTIPSAAVSYEYGDGGVFVTASSATNQNELRVNDPGPAMTIQVSTTVRSGVELGWPVDYQVSVTNTGDSPALNLNVDGSTDPTLIKGGVWQFNVTLPVTSLLDWNTTRTFTLGWTAPDGSKGALTSNVVREYFSHADMLVPLMRFTVTPVSLFSALRLGTMNATYTLVNGGSHGSTSASVTETLPQGMACKSVVSGPAECTASGFTLSTGAMAMGGDVKGTVVVTFLHDNYIADPASITATYGNLTLHTAGNAMLVPAGVLFTKTYSPGPAFAGENQTVSLQAVNQGSLPVYDLNISSSADSFDTLLSGNTHAVFSSLQPGETQSFNYTVNLTTAGNYSSAAISASFLFGGTVQNFDYSSSAVSILKPVKLILTTDPASNAVGSDFRLLLDLQNPSSVTVSNVTATVQLPQGLTLVGKSNGLTIRGNLATIYLATMAPGYWTNQSVTLKASSAGSFNFGATSLSFQYSGATIQGPISSHPIVIGIDLLAEYWLPLAMGVIVVMVIVGVFAYRKFSAPRSTRRSRR